MAEKLTPEEIKKALECCATSSAVKCRECPLYGQNTTKHCAFALCGVALALINRQQAGIDVYMQENDRLKTAYIQVSMDRDEIKAENDELKREREVMLEDLQFRTNQVIEQQAEIERLQKANGLFEYVTKAVHQVKIGGEYWSVDFVTEEAKNEEINKKIDFLCDVQTARAEAIKEFAEKLKDDSWFTDLYDRNDYPVRAVTKEDIDNLVKEMAGEQE